MYKNMSQNLYINEDIYAKYIDPNFMVHSPACHRLLECHCMCPAPLQSGDAPDMDNKPIWKIWGFAVRQKEGSANPGL